MDNPVKLSGTPSTGLTLRFGEHWIHNSLRPIVSVRIIQCAGACLYTEPYQLTIHQCLLMGTCDCLVGVDLIDLAEMLVNYPQELKHE